MPSRKPIPAVSHVGEDGTLVELVHDPAAGKTAFAVRQPDGATSILADFTTATGDKLVPYSAANSLLASGCVMLPSDIGDFRDKGDLLEGVREFLARYVDLTPAFAEIAAHYVLLTWVYDRFSELPYLRFRGDYGSGKTRALLSIGALCYKAFFASGASTVSPIFHVLDVFGGTLAMDEADFRFSDATAELTKILNNGNMRGLPVLRTMTNRHNELNPRAFQVYGPKLIAMRRSFSDDALESRFLTEETGGRPLPAHIPIHLPEGFHGEARLLRNQLLAWRLRCRTDVGPDPARLVQGVSPRANQTALALLSLVDDPQIRERIRARLLMHEDGVRTERSASIEALMLTALHGAFAQSAGPGARVGDVTERFNSLAEADLGKPMTAKWVGAFLRNRLRLGATKTGGVYIVPADERNRVAALAERYGLHLYPTDAAGSLSAER